MKHTYFVVCSRWTKTPHNWGQFERNVHCTANVILERYGPMPPKEMQNTAHANHSSLGENARRRFPPVMTRQPRVATTRGPTESSINPKTTEAALRAKKPRVGIRSNAVSFASGSKFAKAPSSSKMSCRPGHPWITPPENSCVIQQTKKNMVTFRKFAMLRMLDSSQWARAPNEPPMFALRRTRPYSHECLKCCAFSF